MSGQLVLDGMPGLDLPEHQWTAPPDPAPGRAPVLHISCPEPAWLARPDMPPLLVTRARMERLARPPRAVRGWILDSDGFRHLGKHGRWTITAAEYAAQADEWMRRIGLLKAAAVQDWCCEQHICDRTRPYVSGLAGADLDRRGVIDQHQRLTIASYLELRKLAPRVPWMPVIQGWTAGQYRRHADMWEDAGVDLAAAPLVGLGSVCSRSGSQPSLIPISQLVRDLAERGVRLHAFGLKTTALPWMREHLVSVDSAACFKQARCQNMRAFPDCPHPGDCRNCPRWAAHWHRDLSDRDLVRAA
ncbi:DUF7221 family queuine tRNA-ribosyltransferase-like protein [Nonomuraea salmonea]|uniref:DeoxyPurine in DNA protein A domain-containing protein n=1 Tax=Nonomuraea salmonea TaxID=46181 RepID=A0ABV5P309_9ACTN